MSKIKRRASRKTMPPAQDVAAPAGDDAIPGPELKVPDEQTPAAGDEEQDAAEPTAVDQQSKSEVSAEQPDSKPEVKAPLPEAAIPGPDLSVPGEEEPAGNDDQPGLAEPTVVAAASEPPPAQWWSIDVKNVPIGSVPVDTYITNHVEVRLSHDQAYALRSLWFGLQDAGVKLDNDKPITSNADVVRWLLEQMSHRLDAAEGVL